MGKPIEGGGTQYFNYNAEAHWFWAEIDGDPELKRLRIEHQAALDFLGWERSSHPDKISSGLDDRRDQLLRRALEVRQANKAKEFGIHLLTIDEARGWAEADGA